MALLDTTDSEELLNTIAGMIEMLEGQDWGTDEPGYNEALSRLENFRKQIVVLSPDEDEDDASGEDAAEPTAA